MNYVESNLSIAMHRHGPHATYRPPGLHSDAVVYDVHMHVPHPPAFSSLTPVHSSAQHPSRATHQQLSSAQLPGNLS
jgi:hypothetical protein